MVVLMVALKAHKTVWMTAALLVAVKEFLMVASMADMTDEKSDLEWVLQKAGGMAHLKVGVKVDLMVVM